MHACSALVRRVAPSRPPKVSFLSRLDLVTSVPRHALLLSSDHTFWKANYFQLTANMMIPTPLFMVQHVALVALIAMAYPEKHRPYLYAFGAVQGVVEHYADAFPNVAAAGPFLVPIGIVLLGLHYYYANKMISNKWIVYGGFVFYFVLLVAAKGLDWGFPKDTAEEQIAALSDEEYVTAHFWFHNALLVCLALTAFSLPKTEDDKKEASKKFAMPTGSPVADAFAEKTK